MTPPFLIDFGLIIIGILLLFGGGELFVARAFPVLKLVTTNRHRLMELIQDPFLSRGLPRANTPPTEVEAGLSVVKRSQEFITERQKNAFCINLYI
jgi:hypothetical protein